MTFEEILDQAVAMLQRRGRLTYGTLKWQFQLAAALEDLTNELIKGQRLACDEDGAVLVWTGAVLPPVPVPTPPATAPAPLAYTPPPEVPWKANANRSRSYLPISRAPWSYWPTATPRKRARSSTPCWSG